MGSPCEQHITPVSPAILRSLSGSFKLNGVVDSLITILPGNDFFLAIPISFKSSRVPCINALLDAFFTQPCFDF